MNRRSFLTVLGSMVPILGCTLYPTPRIKPAPPCINGVEPTKDKPCTRADCACCGVVIEENACVVFDRAHFAKMPVGGLDYSKLNWGTSYTLCDECAQHRGLMRVSVRRDRITARSLQAELTNQERTPTGEGFYSPLAAQYHLAIDPSLVKDAETLFVVQADRGEAKATACNLPELTIIVRPIAHFKHGQWALIPVRS